MRIGFVELVLLLFIASITVGPNVALFVDRWLRRAQRTSAAAARRKAQLEAQAAIEREALMTRFRVASNIFALLMLAALAYGLLLRPIDTPPKAYTAPDVRQDTGAAQTALSADSKDSWKLGGYLGVDCVRTQDGLVYAAAYNGAAMKKRQSDLVRTDGGHYAAILSVEGELTSFAFDADGDLWLTVVTSSGGALCRARHDSWGTSVEQVVTQIDGAPLGVLSAVETGPDGKVYFAVSTEAAAKNGLESALRTELIAHTGTGCVYVYDPSARTVEQVLGGVAGACMTEGASSLTDCYSAGEVRNAHTYASSGTGGLIGYGNDYRAENCFSYGAVSAAAGTAGGLIGRDSSRSTNVRENLYYRADSCGTAVGGKAEASGTAARTAAEFAALSFLRQLDKNGCFMLENGAYPELPASARCAHLETELRDARAATCTEAGYTGDTVCKACGTEITHGEAVPAAGHQYRNGACTVCGAKDPRWSGTERPWNDPFRDVRTSDWFYSGVKFAYQHGLFQGTAADMFSPDEPMTRAMLVTVLWRMDGKPGAAGGSSFTDVPRGQWYTEAVAWAAENGVVNGVGGGKFEPDGNVTREQIATILYRYAGLRGVPTGGRADLGSFPDGGAVSGWAYDALSWANAAGLIAGTREGGVDYLAPQQNATRAQVAVILMRYLGAA